MESSSASSTHHNAEDLELEQVRSDLHALKVLYGLLRKRESDTENALRETEDWLDEKSRAFLVKLLDEATQRALRRQAKVLSCAVLSPSLDLAQRRRPDQASDSAVGEVAMLEESSTVEASPSRNPGPSREGPRLLKRLESRRPVLSRDVSKHGHDRPIRRDLDRADRVITRVDHELARQQGPRPTIAKPPRRSPTKHAAAAAGYNSGEPAHKRSRLESEDERPGRTPSRLRADRRTEHELTRVKGRAERAHGPELNVAMRALRRSGSLKSGRLVEPAGSPDRRAQISQPKKRADQGKEIVKFSSRRSRLAAPEKPPSRAEVRVDRVIKTSGELGRRSSRLEEREDKQNGGTTDRVGPSRTNRPPMNPSKMGSNNKARYSSSSGSTTRSSDSGSSPRTASTTESHSSTRSARERAASASASTRNSKHRGQVPRRAMGPSVPRRHPAAPSRAAPTGRRTSDERRRRRRRPPESAKADHQKKPADQREGRLGRLRNKLAIVFHHHHHHHHHHNHRGHADGDSSSQEEEEDDDDEGAHRHRRSPWRYLRRILHRAGDEEDRGRGRKLATEARGERAAGKVVPARHQHGHVGALFEALLRHVWGTRTRRRKPVRASRPGVGRSANGVRLPKLHWWQRLRKRGGVKLANSKNKTPLGMGRN